MCGCISYAKHLGSGGGLGYGGKKWSSLTFKEPMLIAGPPLILLGVMCLNNLKRFRSKGPAPDNTEDEN